MHIEHSEDIVLVLPIHVEEDDGEDDHGEVENVHAVEVVPEDCILELGRRVPNEPGRVALVGEFLTVFVGLGAHVDRRAARDEEEDDEIHY